MKGAECKLLDSPGNLQNPPTLRRLQIAAPGVVGNHTPWRLTAENRRLRTAELMEKKRGRRALRYRAAHVLMVEGCAVQAELYEVQSTASPLSSFVEREKLKSVNCRKTMISNGIQQGPHFLNKR